MALVVKNRKTFRLVKGYLIIGTLDFDNSYPTGGEPTSPIADKLEAVFPQSITHSFEFVKSTQKLKVGFPTNVAHSGSPASQAVNVNTGDTGLEANFGSGTLQVAGAEAADAKDLSGLTDVPFWAIAETI